MVVKAVDAVDEEEMEAARQRADRVVRRRYRENAAREDAIEAAEEKSRERGGGSADLNEPLWKIWALLRPTARTLFTSEFEALGMVAINVIKLFELYWQMRTARALDRTLWSRNRSEWAGSNTLAVPCASDSTPNQTAGMPGGRNTFDGLRAPGRRRASLFDSARCPANPRNLPSIRRRGSGPVPAATPMPPGLAM